MQQSLNTYSPKKIREIRGFKMKYHAKFMQHSKFKRSAPSSQEKSYKCVVKKFCNSVNFAELRRHQPKKIKPILFCGRALERGMK